MNLMPEAEMFDKTRLLHDLKHYLPAQAPLKDFIHHNTLHAMQHLKFSDAVLFAERVFGYKTLESLGWYRQQEQRGRISSDLLEEAMKVYSTKPLDSSPNHLNAKADVSPRIGRLRLAWRNNRGIDLNQAVHPILFRLLGAYLDQGIATWKFPFVHRDFISSIVEMERNSPVSVFKTKHCREILLAGPLNMQEMLERLLGDTELFERYIWGQQFAHPGWSGIVAQLEEHPKGLFEYKRISLEEVINLELLLEMDYLYSLGDPDWAPLSKEFHFSEVPLFSPILASPEDLERMAYQEAFEWTYYREVLSALVLNEKNEPDRKEKSFQAFFCIDDRECSLRRHLEDLDSNCETFGTPGHFGVEFFFLPEEGKFYSKLCPAPLQPKYLVREVGRKLRLQKDAHFSPRSHSLLGGWLIAQSIGFWSALRLFVNVFKPSFTPATASAFRHMDKQSTLEYEFQGKYSKEGLQIGFNPKEMASRVEALLISTGLLKDFAPLVYMIGHGSTSTNNPYYAAYDCGACSGRPGSVNARVIAAMANQPGVRSLLKEQGIEIPESTWFVGAMHDTSRDEVIWYDLEILPETLQKNHQKNAAVFEQALRDNAVERSRRFELIDSQKKATDIHELVKMRSVSLFETRPELNHATNALAVVGRRALTRDVFLDRRAFLNSYDYRTDPEGVFLPEILNALIPVCAGINLEYYFSRTDSMKLGASSKLPHNVVGLFGLANGIEGDLRTGLPIQMTEVHDPIRLLLIVEHFPEKLINILQNTESIRGWIVNEWIHLVVIHPEEKKCYRYQDGVFKQILLALENVPVKENYLKEIGEEEGNINVFMMAKEE